MRKIGRILFFGAVCGAASTRALAAPKIEGVDVHVDGETDLPRIMDLLALKEGDYYSEVDLERGLVRLADSGKFVGISGRFDDASGRLQVQLALVPRVIGVEVQLKASLPTEGTGELESDVRDAVGLSPGDPVFPDQIPGIRDRLLARLRDRGYRAAQPIISLEQPEGSTNMKVVVSVDLGRRTSIRKIEGRGFSKADIDTLFRIFKIDEKKKPLDAKGDFRVETDIPYDSIQVDDEVSARTRRARLAGFYDFQLKMTEAGHDPDITLIFELSRGLRYDLQFRGNVEFWENALREKVIDRPLRLGVPLNLQEAEALVVREYESAGFPEAVVHARIDDKDGVRIVRFEIIEGRRFYQGPVRLLGIPDADAPALDKTVSDWLMQYQSAFRRMPFDEKFIRGELPVLLGRIRSMGYLDARILEMRQFPELDRPYVDVELPMQLGERYTVRSVAVVGNLSLTRKELDEIVDMGPGDALDPQKVLLVRERLLRKYQNLGFLNVKIAGEEARIMKRVPENQSVDVEYLVEQGPLIRVGTAVLEGLRKTNERVVLRELRKDTLQPGGIWSPSGTEQLSQRLNGLNLFSNITFEPVGGRIIKRASPDSLSPEVQEKDLKITVNERDPGSIEFGPGFRTDKGVIGVAELNYRNLGGWNRFLQLKTQISERLRTPTSYGRILEQDYLLTYLEPYVFEQKLRLKFSARHEFADHHFVDRSSAELGYNEQTSTLGFETDTQITRHLRWVQNLYTLSFTNDFDARNTAATQYRDSDYRTATIGTAFYLDLRDNIFNPTRGWYFSSAIAYSSPEIGSKSYDAINSDVHFARFKQEAVTWVSLGARSTLEIYASYLQIWALGRGGVPIGERPYFGGRDLRSFAERGLSLTQHDVGDERAYLAKIEYQQTVFGDLGISYFLDMGEIDGVGARGSSGGRYSTTMRTAFGVGLRYKLPIGPIALYIAYNANPAPGELHVRPAVSLGSF